MIIFDDIEFTKQLASGKIPKNIYQNTTFRSLARTMRPLNLSKDDARHIIENNTKFDPEKMEWYFEEYGSREPVTPHPVTFSRADIIRINKLRVEREKKLYIAILFLSKYFNAKRLRLSLREVKAIMGLGNQNSLNYKTVKMGAGVTIRREKEGNRMTQSEIRNHKGYFYYYVPEDEKHSNKTAFQFLYKGSAHYLPSTSFESNLDELWESYLKASEKDREKRRAKNHQFSKMHVERNNTRYPEQEAYNYVTTSSKVSRRLHNILADNEFTALRRLTSYISILDGTIRLKQDEFLAAKDIARMARLGQSESTQLMAKLDHHGIIYRHRVRAIKEKQAAGFWTVTYINPYIYFAKQYIDLEVAEYFKGTVWHKLNEKSPEIDSWIEKYCH